MSRIVTCLDCPLYQKGGYCRHYRKDVGALQPACDHATKMDLTFNPEDKEDDMTLKEKIGHIDDTQIINQLNNALGVSFGLE